MPEIRVEGNQERKEQPKRLVVEIGGGDMPAFMKFVQDDWLMSEVENSLYYNVDISLETLKQQEDLNQITKAHNIDFVNLNADGKKLPFKDGSLDTVLFADVLSYRVLPNPMEDATERQKYLKETSVSVKDEVSFRRSLLEEIYRVLKSKGKVFIADFYRILHPEAYSESKKIFFNDKRFVHKVEIVYNNGKMGPVDILEKI